MESRKFQMDDDFIIHEEMLSQLFLIKEVKDDEIKRAHLLTSLSIEVFKLLKNMCAPVIPSKIEYKELVAILKKQFVKNTVIYRERRKFYEACHNNGESLREFYNKIKSLAVNCEFGNQLDDILKDKFICSMKVGPIYDRVCEEETNTPLSSILELVYKREITEEENQCHVVMKQKSYKAKYNKVSCADDVPKCNACGRINHDFKRCKYRNFVCRRCNTKGHLERVCEESKNKNQMENNRRRSFNKKTENNHFVTEDQNIVEEGDEEEGAESLSLFHLEDLTDGELDLSEKGKNMFHDINDINFNYFSINCFSNSFKVDSGSFTASLNIDGIPLDFEIDTGSAISAIPLNLYCKRFRHHKLNEFTPKLKAYDGSIIDTKGTFTMSIENKGKISNVSFVVIDSKSKPLLGRDILRLLGFEMRMNSIDVDCELKKIGLENSELFRKNLGEFKGDKIHFDLIQENIQPIFIKPRKVPFAYKIPLENELIRLEKLGIIEKANTVSWGTPLVTVMKGNGKLRVCGDYSVTINPVIKDQNYPLPKIDDIFQSLQGGKQFSKIDLSEAYFQLRVDDETADLLAWSTHKGVFRVKRLPFGCKPNTSIFQSVMERTLSGCDGTVIFVDDVVVTGETTELHLKNLKNVFEKLKNAGFTVNKDKCCFFQAKVEFLGYIIDEHGLHKDPRKIEAIRNMPNPTNKTEIKAFCGLINYYGRFVPNVSSVLKPLYELSTKDNFVWNKQCEKSVIQIKKLIMSDVVLVHYDPHKSLELHTDACESGLGACLSHRMNNSDLKPIAFASRTLTKPEQNYSMIDKEALAIFYGVKKFEQYLIGRSFIIRTDHKPLVAIFGSKKGIPVMAASRLTRWAVYLSMFDFKIVHIRGEENNCADALSRLTTNKDDVLDDTLHLNFITNRFGKPLRYDDVAKQSEKDSVLREVLGYIKNGWPDVKGLEGEMKSYFIRKLELSLENSVIMWGYRIVIPEAFRKDLLKEIHTGHLGIVKSKELARSYFWWPGIDKDLENWIKSCEVCRENQSNPSKVIGSWPPTTYPFQRIHVDFCHPNNSNYLVVIDSFTKWMEVSEVKSLTTSNVIIELEKMFSKFGMPYTIVSDNGTCFTSKQFSEFCNNNGIVHITSPAYHAPSNGQAENSVRIFKKMFEKELVENSKQDSKSSLEHILQKILYVNRNSVHTKTNKTPYEMMFSRKPILRWDMLKPSYNHVHNKHEINPKFKIGQNVYIKSFHGKGSKWQRGKIVRILGKSVFDVKIENGRIIKSHENHMTAAQEKLSNKESLGMCRNSSGLLDILNKNTCSLECNNDANPIIQPNASNVSSYQTLNVDESLHTNNKKNILQSVSSDAHQNQERPKRTVKPPKRLNL